MLFISISTLLVHDLFKAEKGNKFTLPAGLYPALSSKVLSGQALTYMSSISFNEEMIKASARLDFGNTIMGSCKLNLQ